MADVLCEARYFAKLAAQQEEDKLSDTEDHQDDPEKTTEDLNDNIENSGENEGN